MTVDTTSSSGNHSLDPSCERPSHFPSGFPWTRMMSRHSPCFRVRSVLLPLQSEWAFTWWMAVSGPTSWCTKKNKFISQHLLVEQTVHFWKNNVSRLFLTRATYFEFLSGFLFLLLPFLLLLLLFLLHLLQFFTPLVLLLLCRIPS